MKKELCSLTFLKKALSFPQGGDLAAVPSLVSQFSEDSQYFGPAPTNRFFSGLSGVARQDKQEDVRIQQSHTHTHTHRSISYLNWSHHWTTSSFN